MDPKAKVIRALKRQKRALDLIRQGVQLLQWGLVKLDDNVFIIGHKETALYVKELVDESNRAALATPLMGSLELGKDQVIEEPKE